MVLFRPTPRTEEMDEMRQKLFERTELLLKTQERLLMVKKREVREE